MLLSCALASQTALDDVVPSIVHTLRWQAPNNIHTEATVQACNGNGTGQSHNGYVRGAT